MVLDPFGGSCVTGMVAENLKRKWACIELSSEYIRGGMARFQSATQENIKGKSALYSINTPCAQPIDESKVPLHPNGGETR
jgi:site-specific DNA-methyltransferase (cytosine-N4-specific)